MGAEYHQLPHQPSQARALSTLQGWLLYFCPFQQNPRGLKRANKQTKKKKKIQQEKKPSICWKCWATSALILLMCPWNFLHVLLCKCQKTMALFLQILGNIFFGCAPYTSSFLTHYVSEQGLKRTCLRNISLTYPEIWVCTRSWGSGEFSRVFPFSLWTLYVTLLTNS